MPAPGKKWRHVIINTRSSWLHGDKRGFRSRRHRIHSSGDYKNPPPAGEHEALYRYRLEHSRPEVHIDVQLRRMVGCALRNYLEDRGHRVLCVAVSKVHAHLLAELPDNIVRIKAIVGLAKRRASNSLGAERRGTLWAQGGTFKPIKSPAHQRSAYEYILYDQGAQAWTWSFRDAGREGEFGRRPTHSRGREPR